MIYELSYWERESFLNNIDIVVVGSGLVGLCAAIRAKERFPNQRIVVLERGGMPLGASTRNAGFACFGSMTELIDDLQHTPAETVWNVVERRWKGLQQLRKITGDQAIHYFQHGGFELFTEAENALFEDCMDHLSEFNRIAKSITGHPEVYKNANDQLPKFGFKGVRNLLINQAEGQIHTGQMMNALLRKAREKGVEILNGISIQQLEDTPQGIVLHTTAGWSIQASQAIICANGFARQLLPQLEVWPARNQVLITQPIPGLKVEGCFHYDRGYIYFRNIDGRILLGGARNLDFEGEQTDQFEANTTIRQALTNFLHEVICPNQNVQIDTWWTGIMGLGPIKKPIVKRISPHVIAAVRLSGMGVAIGAGVGTEGADLL